MGWWRATKDGGSLAMEETGLIWGDGPADVMGPALDAIIAQFEMEWNRKPTMDELISGVIFSARPLLEEI